MTTDLNTLPRIDWDARKVLLTDYDGAHQEFYLPDSTRGALVLFFTQAGFCHNTAWDFARATLATWKEYARD